jgi:hypothetical protein
VAGSLVEIEPTEGKMFLNFHPGQSRAWRSRRRFILILAGSQGGKTAAGPHWLRREIYGGELEPGIILPGRGPGDYLAVTSTYDLFKLKMLPAILELFEGQLGVGRYWAGDGVLELKDPYTGRFWARKSMDRMWGRVILRSASSEGGLESATAKAAWLDEAGQDDFRLASWEAVLRRVSLSQGRVLITTTPYGLGWIKTELVDRWDEGRGDPDIDVIQFESILNPAFPRAEFERARRTMAAWKFAMFYQGRFSRPAGLIYNDFHEEQHLVAPFPIPKEWPRFVGIDFGAVHTAMVWIARDPDSGKHYVYRESLQGGLTTKEHCQKAMELVWSDMEQMDEKEQVKVRYFRHYHWYGGAASEVQERRDWLEGGIPVEQPKVGDVEAGIDRVISLFKTDRLFVFKGLPYLREELNTYSREVNDKGEPMEEIKNKTAYHVCDSLRYVCAALVARKVGISWA